MTTLHHITTGTLFLCIEYVEDLKQPEFVELPKETLEEEQAADKELTEISRKVNVRELEAAA